MFQRHIRRFSTSATATSAVRNVRKLKDKRTIIKDQRQRNAALKSDAEAAKLDWRIVCSTYVFNFSFFINSSLKSDFDRYYCM